MDKTFIKPVEDKYLPENCSWQGIPSITISRGGRLFVNWYSGGKGEGPDNFVLIATSDDKGETWSAPHWVIESSGAGIRAYDPALFTAPDGRIFCFWAQCTSEGIGSIFDGRSGVWFAVCDNPDDEISALRWSEPQRICDGVMMNRPVILSNGEWALPVSIWNIDQEKRPAEETGSMIYISDDNGKTFHFRGKVQIPAEAASYDEHSIYELADHRLAMYIRVKGGHYESFSSDMGKSWSPPAPSPICGPSSRAFIGRLNSGKLLLVHNDRAGEEGDRSGRRCNLTAELSGDDGASWSSSLMLDIRDMVSYPDAVQDREGYIHIIYDYNRYGVGHILYSRITEDDINAGKINSPGSKSGVIVAKL